MTARSEGPFRMKLNRFDVFFVVFTLNSNLIYKTITLAKSKEEIWLVYSKLHRESKDTSESLSTHKWILMCISTSHKRLYFIFPMKTLNLHLFALGNFCQTYLELSPFDAIIIHRRCIYAKIGRSEEGTERSTKKHQEGTERISITLVRAV